MHNGSVLLRVDATATYTGLACPRINVRACLASLHIPHPTLVPKITDLRVIALLRSVLRNIRRNVIEFLNRAKLHVK